MAEVLHRGKFEGTLSRRRKTGEHFTARVVITPRRSSDGEAAGFLLISKDISDEIRANALLKQSEANLRAVVDHTIDGLITID
jgi:PAS domain S-box-containing protein